MGKNIGNMIDFSNYEATEKFYLEAISLQGENPKLSKEYFNAIVQESPSSKLKSGSLVSIARIDLTMFLLKWISTGHRKSRVYNSIKSRLEKAGELNPENTALDALFVELYLANEDFDLATIHLKKIHVPAVFEDLHTNLENIFRSINMLTMIKKRKYMTGEARDFYTKYVHNEVLSPPLISVALISNIFINAESKEQKLFANAMREMVQQMHGSDSPLVFASDKTLKFLAQNDLLT
ncbi:hypothetical protein [Exiguobacterium sp. s26]|uniref:hypothetical protein n=1 Tax=Exiguobacterium sp. s26 TaxID=2751231 RepID=UPI001BE4FF1D|nr:hypothetical protein [Exiguobacterium sp. s26]